MQIKGEPMKEKIEEIYMDTLKLTDDEWVAKYGEGNGYHEAFETLIQQEREEAVRGFFEFLCRKQLINDEFFTDLADLERYTKVNSKGYESIDYEKLIVDYLTQQSLDKGDRDE
jgi:hypothetical protein